MLINLDKAITAVEMDMCRDSLIAIAKPSVELIASDQHFHVGCSKFGGAPDVSKNFVWPRHEFGNYRFFCQIDLSEMPKNCDKLPSSGLLSFFYAHDEDGQSFWRDPNYVRVFHFDSNEAIEQFLPPESVRFGGSRRVRLEPGHDIPRWPDNASALAEWPINEEYEDAYWELRMELHPGRGYLLGYPLNTTLGYDPTPGPSWSSLLTLGSDDELEWCWHDGDWLVTFFDGQKVGDFSDIKADAG